MNTFSEVKILLVFGTVAVNYKLHVLLSIVSGSDGVVSSHVDAF